MYEKDLQPGKDEVIASALSYYRTDAILRVKDIDRYGDKLI